MYEIVDETKRADRRIYPMLGTVKRLGIMLHTTDGQNSLDWLLGGSIPETHASADYLIARTGLIHRLAPAGRYAYHAGVCLFGDQVDRNNVVSRLMIGIEIENADSKGQIPTVDQHKACAGLVREIAHAMRFSPLSVYGHYGLAYPMGRRSDPRSWDWGYMFWLVAFGQTLTQLMGATHLIGK